MSIVKKHRAILNILLVIMLMALAMLVSSFSSHAISGLEASGNINSSNGAVLRSKASTAGKKLAVLKNGSVVEVQKEVFTTKKKTGKKNKWYLVNTGAGVGYVRSDLVKIKCYGTATGTAKKKIAYRKGAGTKMAKKGNIKKKSTFTIILEAKAKGSNAIWYKIKKGSKFYYVKKTNTSIADITSGLSQVSSANPALDIVQSPEALAVVNGACAWAVDIANDNRFHYGYGQAAHHNGCYFCNTQMLTGGRSKAGIVDYQFTYCCNPYVHAAFAHGGGEQTMLSICQRGTSYDYHKGKGYDVSPLFAKLGVPKKEYLKKGDVICKDYHVMLYIGDGMIAEAGKSDDNVPYSDSWNDSIRLRPLTDTKYAQTREVYRYIGNGN